MRKTLRVRGTQPARTVGVSLRVVKELRRVLAGPALLRARRQRLRGGLRARALRTAARCRIF
jgi:hypothetical protein